MPKKTYYSKYVVNTPMYAALPFKINMPILLITTVNTKASPLKQSNKN